MLHTFSNVLARAIATGAAAISVRASVLLDWNLVTPHQLPGERSQRRVQILVVNNDVCRHFKTYRCEVPDCLDAPPDHFIGDGLRKFSRRGDDAEVDAHALGKI